MVVVVDRAKLSLGATISQRNISECEKLWDTEEYFHSTDVGAALI